jgi:hypothetical protein
VQLKNISKITGFFCVLIFSINTFSQVMYWEDLTEYSRKEILNAPGTFMPAVDFYKGKLIPNDDSLTFLLLDTITGAGNFNQLYFYEFNEILKKSDGALAEAMGEYCGNMLYNYPNETFNYIINDTLIKRENSLLKLYTDFMGWEFGISGYVLIGDPEFKIDIKQFEKYLKKNILQNTEAKLKNFKLFIEKLNKAYKENK